MSRNKLIKKIEDKKEILKSLHLTEDELIDCRCSNCGNTCDLEDVQCDECGSDDLLWETAHEGLTCSDCKCTLDMYEDCYRSYGLDELIYCKDCHKELEIEIEDLEIDLESEIEDNE